MNYKIEIDETYKGFRYVVKLLSMGHRCGYILIPKDKKDLIDIDDIDCHGGITFNNNVEEGEDFLPASGYWIGFDCIHYGDAIDVDALKKEFNKDIDECINVSRQGHVWSKDEVAVECCNIIDQLTSAWTAREKNGNAPTTEMRSTDNDAIRRGDRNFKGIGF